ncbi:MAG: ATP-binding cassette domain-containing protein [Gammaproteobacteria bacterium]|nr:ATP-binding cassette domain-containing protein [Gammaproteobacteria bacterium]
MTFFQLTRFKSRGLEPIDLTIDAGECITLGGASGCGKSLLLRAIADLDPHEGEARIDECCQSQTAPPVWRRQAGLLSAESHWWADRVGDHLPRSDPDLLVALGFSEATTQWEVSRLSSGERQRLALVRLLLGNPKLLLLDEPTANLDQTSIDRVEHLIKEYLQDSCSAALWVSHDPQQRRRIGDRGFQIESGRLVAEKWS